MKKILNPFKKKCSKTLSFDDELQHLTVGYEQAEGPPVVHRSKFMFPQENHDIYMAWDDDIVRMKGKTLAGDGTFKLINSYGTYKQIYIISMLVKDEATNSTTAFPVCFGLLVSKTKTSYIKFLRWINARYREVISEIRKKNPRYPDDHLLPQYFLWDGFMICSYCSMFALFDVRTVRCSHCSMFALFDVRTVRCSHYL